MRSTKPPSRQLITQVERVRQRLERWRRTRKKRTRIPEQLWQESVEVARSNGVNQTARALGLDYYGLKRRLDAGLAGSAVEQEPVASFVELVGASPAVVSECLVEVESASGTKMRIHLKGAPDVALLRSLLWGGEG
jgi:hypothetical protein